MKDSMALSFVGAGALGQTFAGFLAARGQQTTLLATPASAARLLGAGEIRLRGIVHQTVPVGPAPAPAGTVGVTSDPHDLSPRTGLIFATKGHQLAAAIGLVREAWPGADDAESWVAGIQNGIVKDDQLAAAFGIGRVVGAVTILAGGRETDGTVTVSSLGMTYLGELTGGVSPRSEHAAALVRQAGIPAEAFPDIQSVLWSKECNAVGVFGVSVLARSSAPAIFRDAYFLRAYLGLIRETAAVAAAHGVVIGDYAGFPIRTYLDRSDDDTITTFTGRATTAPGDPPKPESVPSMTQDLLAGRPLEADAVFTALVERAARVGVDVPRVTIVRDLISGLNRRQVTG